MIVLIEGYEEADRRLLRTLLCRDLGLSLDECGLVSWMASGEQLVQEIDQRPNRILTQFHIAAYAEASGEEFDAYRWSLIDTWLARRDTYFILLTDTPFAIEARLKEWGLPAPSRHEIGATLQKYWEAFRASSIGNKGSYRLAQFYDRETRLTTPMYGRLVEQLKGLLR